MALDAGKLVWYARTLTVRTCGATGKYSRRMLKKAVQQGCSKRRGEEVQTALRVGRSPLQWFLANGKAPQRFDLRESLRYVELLSEARTKHGKRRVSACRGRAGEKSDFFSILLVGIDVEVRGEWTGRDRRLRTRACGATTTSRRESLGT